MQAIRSAMAEMIRESGMSVRTLAKRSNIPEATIRNILHGRVIDPRLSTVNDICIACGTTIERLFRSLDSVTITAAPVEVPALPDPPFSAAAIPDEALARRAAEEEADAELRAAQEHLRRAIAAWEALRGI
jgi:transcriptional regulator with XRE-family HTH domain